VATVAALVVVSQASGCPEEKSVNTGNQQVAELLVDVVDVSPGASSDAIAPDLTSFTGVAGRKYKLEVAAYDGQDISLTNPNGNLITDVKFKWTNPSLVSLVADNNATDDVETVSTTTPGSGTIQITIDDPRITFTNGFTGTLNFPIVLTRPAASIDLSPSSGTVQVGHTLDVQLLVKDAQGAPAALDVGEVASVVYPDPTILWDTDHSNLSFFDQTKTLHIVGIAPGTGRVEVRSSAPAIDRFYSFTVVPVNNNPVATVTLTPSTASCHPGGTVQFTARSFDAQGGEVFGVTYNWLVDASNVGSVNSSGLVTCGSVGTTNVRAFAGFGANVPGAAATLNVTP